MNPHQRMSGFNCLSVITEAKPLDKSANLYGSLLVPHIAFLSQVWEPVLLLGANRYREVDIRIRVKGGGHVSQIYAIRQAIAKALVAWYQKCE